MGAAVHRQRLLQALRWTPENPWYWRKLAELEAQAAWPLLQGDERTADMRQRAVAGLRQAAALYQRALDQHPTEPYTQLAWLQEYQRLVALRPDAEIFYYLGEHFRQAGDLLRALGYYRRAVQLRPDQAGFRQALDNLEKRLQKPRPP